MQMLVVDKRNMKKIYGLVFCLFGIVLLMSQQKGYVAFYNLQYKLDSLDRNNIRNEAFILNFEDSKSSFLSLTQYRADSIIAKDRNEGMQQLGNLMSLPISKFKKVIVKNFSARKMDVYDLIVSEKYHYIENLPPLQWSLKDEFKTVDRFKVQKAETYYAGRNYVAWFAREIPIFDGPYKFTGLPGLIIEIHDSRYDYHFKLTNLFKKDKDWPLVYNKSPKEMIFTDKNKFHSILESHKKNPMIKFNAKGIYFKDQEAESRKMIERKSKENNPIELKPVK